VAQANLIGRRYAQGIFQLAESEQNIDGWRQELVKLEELLKDDVLRAAFANPAVTMQRRMELAKLLAPELRPQTENLLRLLVEHHRTIEMQEIRKEFDRLADEAEGFVNATLTTATDLTDADKHQFQQELAQRLGRRVRLEHHVDPLLIGGAVIQVGDRLVDGSVRMQLSQLRQNLVA
jgi:F-type H+-transporting ATPase subunit delta